MRSGSENRRSVDDFHFVAKLRQASKLTEIREALVAAGHDTAAKQAAALGVSRATAWALLNRDKRTGPSSVVIKRILSSPHLPGAARQKIQEYVDEKIAGLYGHTEHRRRWFRDQIMSFQSDPGLIFRQIQRPSQSASAK